ncbi:hypothetical protein JCM8097_003077 [Rhodosporidiobolus ruineniae]
MSGLSLWLSPPPSSALRPLVARLAHAHHTESFLPHATLVSDEIVPAISLEEVIEKTEQGVREWRQEGEGRLKLRFKDVRQGPAYYQCVLAALHPDPPLLALHEAVVRQFHVSSPPPPYFPHLSLVYGDLSTQLKATIIDELKADNEVVEVPGQDGEEGGVEIVGEGGFEPSVVLLVRTAGTCATWEVLARIPLLEEEE